MPAKKKETDTREVLYFEEGYFPLKFLGAGIGGGAVFAVTDADKNVYVRKEEFETGIGPLANARKDLSLPKPFPNASFECTFAHHVRDTPGVTKFKGASYHSKGSKHIDAYYMPFCNGGDVESIKDKAIAENVQLDEYWIYKLTKTMIETLRNVHEKDIVHNDTTGKNWFLDCKSTEDVEVVLGDFGYCMHESMLPKRASFPTPWYLYQRRDFQGIPICMKQMMQPDENKYSKNLRNLVRDLERFTTDEWVDRWHIADKGFEATYEKKWTQWSKRFRAQRMKLSPAPWPFPIPEQLGKTLPDIETRSTFHRAPLTAEEAPTMLIGAFNPDNPRINPPRQLVKHLAIATIDKDWNVLSVRSTEDEFDWHPRKSEYYEFQDKGKVVRKWSQENPDNEDNDDSDESDKSDSGLKEGWEPEDRDPSDVEAEAKIQIHREPLFNKTPRALAVKINKRKAHSDEVVKPNEFEHELFHQLSCRPSKKPKVAAGNEEYVKKLRSRKK